MCNSEEEWCYGLMMKNRKIKTQAHSKTKVGVFYLVMLLFVKVSLFCFKKPAHATFHLELSGEDMVLYCWLIKERFSNYILYYMFFLTFSLSL